MKTFHCQCLPEDSVSAKMATTSPDHVFLDVLNGLEYSSIYLSRADAAELGRYLIQLAEGGE